MQKVVIIFSLGLSLIPAFSLGDSIEGYRGNATVRDNSAASDEAVPEEVVIEATRLPPLNVDVTPDMQDFENDLNNMPAPSVSFESDGPLTEVEITAKHIYREDEECTSAHEKAMSACNSDKFARQAAPMLRMFEMQSASGNLKAACSSAKQISALAAGANTAHAFTCKTAQGSCLKTCRQAQYDSTATKKIKDCEALSELWQATSLQGAANALQYSQSEQCEKEASGECDNFDKAKNNKSCPQYCHVPGRQTDEACIPIVGMCKDPAYARTNPMCVCVTNPNHASCGNGAPNPLTPPEMPTTAGKSPSESWMSSLFGNDEPDGFDGNGELPSRNGGGGSPGGGGSAIAPGGGSGGGYQPSEDGGYAGNPQDNNILNGVARTGGGMPYGYSRSGGGNGASGRGSGYGGKESKELNLRDFLPGGKKDARGIASKVMATAGVSASDGLSNWVKVNRKMSEKRPTLMP